MIVTVPLMGSSSRRVSPEGYCSSISSAVLIQNCAKRVLKSAPLLTALPNEYICESASIRAPVDVSRETRERRLFKRREMLMIDGMCKCCWLMESPQRCVEINNRGGRERVPNPLAKGTGHVLWSKGMDDTFPLRALRGDHHKCWSRMHHHQLMLSD